MLPPEPPLAPLMMICPLDIVDRVMPPCDKKSGTPGLMMLKLPVKPAAAKTGPVNRAPETVATTPSLIDNALLVLIRPVLATVVSPEPEIRI